MKTHKYILAGCCLLLLGATASCEKDLDLYSAEFNLQMQQNSD